MNQLCDYFDNCADELITDEHNCSHPPGKSVHHVIIGTFNMYNTIAER